MNFLKKIFGIQKSQENEVPTKAHADRIKVIKENTDMLWTFIGETVDYYNSVSCPCAFPRFRQIVSLDCTDYGKSFYASETEGFISNASIFFKRQNLESGIEASNELWTCKTCGSVYQYGWSDFSIHVNRTILKIIDLKTEELGAPAELPLPLFVGLFGHNFPDKAYINPVDFETFKSYMLQLKN